MSTGTVIWVCSRPGNRGGNRLQECKKWELHYGTVVLHISQFDWHNDKNVICEHGVCMTVMCISGDRTGIVAAVIGNRQYSKGP